jgi:hypothetical protein
VCQWQCHRDSATVTVSELGTALRPPRCLINLNAADSGSLGLVHTARDFIALLPLLGLYYAALCQPETSTKPGDESSVAFASLYVAVTPPAS